MMFDIKRVSAIDTLCDIFSDDKQAKYNKNLNGHNHKKAIAITARLCLAMHGLSCWVNNPILLVYNLLSLLGLHFNMFVFTSHYRYATNIYSSCFSDCNQIWHLGIVNIIQPCFLTLQFYSVQLYRKQHTLQQKQAMIKENTDAKGNSIKLPQIRSRNLDSPSIHNDSRQQAKLRPASLNKVQDLQKRLFNKLDVYQQITAKKKGKRISSIKDVSFDNFKIENPFELAKAESSQITDKQFDPSLQKLKKLMPQLYGKLMQAKDSSHLQAQSLGVSSSKNIKQHAILNTNQKVESLITIKSKNKSIGATQTTANLKRNHHPFLTELRNSSNNFVSNQENAIRTQKSEHLNKSISKQQNDFERIQKITQKQMQQIYKQYQIQQGFDKEGQNYHFYSTDELKSMGKDLLDCQTEINSIEKSMSSLIRQIGNIYANDMLNIGIQEDCQ